MKIVFIGTVEFSLRALEKLIEMKADVVGVCTLEKSKFNADHVDLSKICEIHNIPWTYVTDINSDESLRWIVEKQADIIFCFGWSRLLGERLLNLSPMGVVGFHPAALPANRGRHPIVWTLVLGLSETASTFFFMNDGADNGDILSQEKIDITDQDDAAILYKKITDTALDQIESFVPQLASGSYLRIKQDHSQSNVWRKRGIADGKIDWRMSAKSIYNLVRGLSKPYVGAHLKYLDNEIKVWKSEVIENLPENIEPGKIIENKSDGVVVKCGEKGIRLLVTEPSFCPAVGEYL